MYVYNYQYHVKYAKPLFNFFLTVKNFYTMGPASCAMHTVQNINIHFWKQVAYTVRICSNRLTRGKNL